MISYHAPSVGEEELAEIAEVLKSGWLTSGRCVRQLQDEFREYVGSRHAQAVNSCTSGLHLALAALGIGPGDEVITTPLTFCGTVNAILHTGARCVLADIGDDGNIDPDRIEAAIGPRTKAIMPVHFAGYPCRMDEIWALARRHGLFVVEDAAHAAGTHYKGTPIGGGSSDAVVFSFYATKNLTTAEGGMIATHDDALAERMGVLCLHGIDRSAWNRYADNGNWFYQVREVGFKYNLSDIHAALGIHQLSKLERFTARRAEIAAMYNAAFAGIEELACPPSSPDGRHCWHLYVLRLRPERLAIDRNEFFNAMRRAGVNCSVHFIPIPLHPAYQDNDSIDIRDGRRSIEWYERSISLPLYPAMTDDMVRRVIDAVLSVTASARLPRVAVAGL